MTASRLAISFDLTAQTQEYLDDMHENPPPQPYLCIDAWPRANGHQLLTSPGSYVFDAVAVLSRGLEAGELDIFTCSCGVAGCIGVHESVQMQVDAEEVRWVFPERPFRAEFNTDLFAPDAPLTLHFAREQYAEALADLRARILGLGEGTALPAVMPPFSYPDLETPIRQMLDEAAEYTQERIEEERHRAVIFGNLLDAEIQVTFPCGVQYRMIVPQLVYEVASQVAEKRGLDDYDDVLEDETLPAFHADHDAMLATARTLAWPDVQRFVWFDTRIEQSARLPLDEREQAYQWSRASLELKLPQ